VKGKFGTERGNKGMIIKNNNDPTTIFAMNFMTCKLLKKCRKEEAHVGVVAKVA
jgi:hypothetical protein